LTFFRMITSQLVINGDDQALCEEAQRVSVAENLRYAAEQSARAGVRILVEPLNPVDVPGFLLPTMVAAVRLLDEVGHENLRILCDVYHLQRAGGT